MYFLSEIIDFTVKLHDIIITMYERTLSLAVMLILFEIVFEDSPFENETGYTETESILMASRKNWSIAVNGT